MSKIPDFDREGLMQLEARWRNVLGVDVIEDERYVIFAVYLFFIMNQKRQRHFAYLVLKKCRKFKLFQV